MNKKQLFYNFLYVIIGVIFAVGLSVVHADPSNIPAGDTPVPLNVGITKQIKGDTSGGALSVWNFVANQNAELDGSTYFNGPLYPDSNPNSPAAGANILFGGTDMSTSPANQRYTSLALTDTLNSIGALISTPLANTSNGTTCGDGQGNVVLCSTTDVCTNIDGTQTTVPAGYTLGSNNQCIPITKHFYSKYTSDKIYAPKDILGGVVDSQLVLQRAPGNTCGSFNPGDSTQVDRGYCMPWFATVGLDNDSPYGWVVDDIGNPAGSSIETTQSVPVETDNKSFPGMIDRSMLLSVTENGSYRFHITSSGKVGMRGKFSDDSNSLSVNFWLRIHHATPNPATDTPCNTESEQARQCLWYQMSPATVGVANNFLHEFYPTGWLGSPESDTGPNNINHYGVNNPAFSEFFGSAVSGTHYLYVPYSFDFDQTYTLQKGDTVNIYATLYGISTTEGTGGIDIFHKSPNNVYFSIESDKGNTIFDITETPQL